MNRIFLCVEKVGWGLLSKEIQVLAEGWKVLVAKDKRRRL
jgi:hypothetical protein